MGSVNRVGVRTFGSITTHAQKYPPAELKPRTSRHPVSVPLRLRSSPLPALHPDLQLIYLLKRCRVRRLPMYTTLNWSRRAVSSLGHFV